MSSNAYSVVISCYNEEAAIPLLWSELADVLRGIEGRVEVVFVDDGSVDDTVRAVQDLSPVSGLGVRVLRLSRNFGHEAAMLAGIEHASGDAIICMDADLQHPPREIPRMLSAFRDGAEIVHMVRARSSTGLLRRALTAVFYGLLNALLPFRIERNATDFFLISRTVAHVLSRHYRRRTRFLRGFLQMVGFRIEYLDFESPPRAAGESKYDSGALFRLAVQAVLAVSNSPLRLGVFVSAVSSGLCLLLAVYTTASFLFSETPPGYATIVILLCTMFVLLFALLCLVLVYLERVHVETRNDPIYLLREDPASAQSSPR